MSGIRPDALAALLRWRDLFGAVFVIGLGIWVFRFGGYFYQALGLLFALVGAGLAIAAIRKLRFHAEGQAPGIVQVDEGQITYLSPEGGGFVALSELTEVELAFDRAGGRRWRLAQAGLPTVTIPAAAEGADALFDAFVSLPGARAGHILAALDRAPEDGPVTVWRRKDRPALT